jgi:diacylglycerol kinase family enzyme
MEEKEKNSFTNTNYFVGDNKISEETQSSSDPLGEVPVSSQSDSNVDKNMLRQMQGGRIRLDKKKKLPESVRKHKINLKAKRRIKNKIAGESRKINKH